MKNFLVIDDDGDDRELFSEALASVDPEIGCYFAEDAEEALKKLDDGEFDGPHVVFLDINLPGMSGWQCLTELKKHDKHRHIPVIMYSTSSHQRDREIAGDLGAVCFVTKPSDFKKLREILKEIVLHTKHGTLSHLNTGAA